ncbi:MAG: double zinc ribbon domain-containing protein [Candidatus Hodarchaeales archaeon]|jgi:RNA polymerase subunit RPABC4/transcription elongation factor Spt4
MIHTRICPKCTKEIISGPHRLHAGQYLSIDLTGIRTATLEAFTCINCGFTELYSDSIGLENIKQHGRIVEKPLHDSKSSCKKCNHALLPQDRYCPSCGEELYSFTEKSQGKNQSKEKTCRICDKMITEREKFCSNCGSTVF